MNTIIEKQLKGQKKDRINSIMDSFFAGCVKYDIYELAQKFNTIPVKDLYTYQKILTNPKVKESDVKAVADEIPTNNTINNPTQQTNPDTSITDFQNRYKEFAFYFDNDIPGPSNKETSDVDYLTTYTRYTDPENIKTYVNNAHNIFVTGDTNYNVKEFFDNVVINNFKRITEGENSFVQQAYRLLNDKIVKSISIVMEGSASATATPEYNKKLSLRRIDSIKNGGY
jgi:hypothetical protein